MNSLIRTFSLFCLLALFTPGLLLAQPDNQTPPSDNVEAKPIITEAPADQGGAPIMDLTEDLVKPLIFSVVFTLVGLVLFALCIWLIVKLAPFSVQKEIEEDQNTSLGIIMGSMILGIAIILAASLVG